MRATKFNIIRNGPCLLCKKKFKHDEVMIEHQYKNDGIRFMAHKYCLQEFLDSAPVGDGEIEVEFERIKREVLETGDIFCGN